MLFKIIVLCTFFNCSGKILRCSQINKSSNLEFYIMQTCTQSTQKVIDRIYAEDIDYCKDFAARRKALSFNYINLENVDNGMQNCIVYECPEMNITALKQYESSYHYYSAYARILPTENTTCIPKEGVYVFSNEKLNYTEAVAKCEEYGGILMNIITEEATNRAANLIIKLKGSFSKLQAYVGLNDIEQESKFLSIHGEPLNCISFRSWAPSEPKSKYDNEDCVTIDAMRYWRVHRCNKTMPFICEITPSGPLDLTQAYCTNINDAGIKKECVDYFTSAEIEVENETCNRTSEQLDTIREQGD